jgi:hypothetical protein
MSLKSIFLSLVITSLALTPLIAQSKPQYEIYAIRYATLPGFSVSELVAGADPARKLDIAMMIWLSRSLLQGLARQRFHQAIRHAEAART